jgi:hypothetical protein
MVKKSYSGEFLRIFSFMEIEFFFFCKISNWKFWLVLEFGFHRSGFHRCQIRKISHFEWLLIFILLHEKFQVRTFKDVGNIGQLKIMVFSIKIEHGSVWFSKWKIFLKPCDTYTPRRPLIFEWILYSHRFFFEKYPRNYL